MKNIALGLMVYLTSYTLTFLCIYLLDWRAWLFLISSIMLAPSSLLMRNLAKQAGGKIDFSSPKALGIKLLTLAVGGVFFGVFFLKDRGCIYNAVPRYLVGCMILTIALSIIELIYHLRRD